MIGGLLKAAWAATVGHKIAIAYYGGLAAIAAIAALGFFQWGHSVASGACQTAALRAERDAARSDLAEANERADRASLVVAALNERRFVNEQEIAKLQGDLAKAKLQSTQPGASHDPSAFLDDQCNYTDHGVSRRLRR